MRSRAGVSRSAGEPSSSTTSSLLSVSVSVFSIEIRSNREVVFTRCYGQFCRVFELLLSSSVGNSSSSILLNK